MATTEEIPRTYASIVNRVSRHTEAAKRQTPIPLSFYPLSFDEAVTDILKLKPEPKHKLRKGTKAK
jgi:hypothetical protein